jgi:DNA (cytosine-5)-methyltransferase 1
MPGLTYGSVCSGIEAASVAWEPIGFRPLWFSEIEPFPCAVLAHRYPSVPNLGDMTAIADRIERGEVEAPDVLVGGTPCQAFSVAGRRGSLDDERGNLSLAFCRLADAIDRRRRTLGLRPCIVLWENVPGVLSTKDNAFGCILAGLAGECVPLVPPRGRWTNAGAVAGPARTVCWRVLDAQWFGLAQRRRRVFAVASAGTVCAVSVLLEREGVRRDSPPSREAREGAAVSKWPAEVAPTLNAAFGDKMGLEDQHALNGAGCFVPVAHSLRASCYDASEDGTGRGTPIVPVGVDCYNHAETGDVAATIGANSGGTNTAGAKVLAFAQNQLGEVRTGDVSGTLNQNGNATGRNAPLVAFGWQNSPSQGPSASEHHTPTLDKSKTPAVGGPAMRVRRLTPRECERLQGFPDDWTLIPYSNKPAADGPRYKAIGNSMAVPVMSVDRREDQAMRAALSKRQRQVYEYLRLRPEATIEDIAIHHGISRRQPTTCCRCFP